MQPHVDGGRARIVALTLLDIVVMGVATERLKLLGAMEEVG
jgi:hypothetical protein